MRIRFTLAILLTLLVAPWLGASTPAVGPEQVISAEDYDEYLPQVAYNSVHNEYLVVWHDSSPFQSRSVMGKRVAADGSTISTFTIAFEDNPPRDNAQPSIAYDQANDVYLVTWTRDYHGDDSDWDIYGRIIPWDGPTGSNAAFSICSFTSKQWNPKVAFAGTEEEFMVTWWNEGSGGSHGYISAQRVAPAGTLTGGNFTVTSSATEERVAPDIAYNQARNEYLVVYQRMDDSGGNIYGVRLTGTGSIIGGGHFGIAAWPDPETAPRVAASRVADEWAVVWQSDIPGMMKDIYTRRLWVDGTGVVQFASPVLVDSTSIDERNPDIAAYSERTEYLISWELQYSNSSGPFGIFARTLSTANVLGPNVDIRGIWAGETATCSKPAVAASPNGWFVTWEHNRDGIPSYQDIHGRFVGWLFRDGFESGDFSGWDEISP
ncbi:MAG: hypothetical protein DRJ65_14450 [Acidobacteria bacterium]|nr:MAG: hypothetical protein DRJ65_14450 [Acidobacteriota bacterium]